ncbi:hypothetical protein ACOKM3_06635 [Streptomyces sp. BH106]|uniref:hypothetical protein n=1 Tax=Streptomyces sp. BH106 TaxID=3410409 RepID=UPI003CE87BE7
MKGYDLFLAAVSVAWIKGDGAADGQALDRLRALIESGYREQDDNEGEAATGHLSPATTPWDSTVVTATDHTGKELFCPPPPHLRPSPTS